MGAEHPVVNESNLLEVEVSDDEWGSLWEEVVQEDVKARETEATTSSQMSEPPSKKGDTVRTENNQEAVELGEGREVSATVEAVEEPLQDLLLVEEEVMELGEVTTMGGQMEMEGKMTIEKSDFLIVQVFVSNFSGQPTKTSVTLKRRKST